MVPRRAHPLLSRNLVLVGGRGCGKSSVAKRLARRNRNFLLFSLDALIRYEADGRSIPDLVAEHGWPHFRELEWQVVTRLAAFRDSALLDCGGGVVVELDAHGEEIFSERKVEALRRHGRVVYLARDPEYLLERIAGDPDRPALSDRHSFLEIMARRDPWYRRAAHWTLDCAGRSKREICELVLEWFYAHGGLDEAVSAPGPSPEGGD